MSLAIKQITLMNWYKTPKDKLTLMMNFCKIVSIMLKETSMGDEEGADTMFPMFVYLIIKANPQNFKSNIEYIELYRADDLLDG